MPCSSATASCPRHRCASGWRCGVSTREYPSSTLRPRARGTAARAAGGTVAAASRVIPLPLSRSHLGREAAAVLSGTLSSTQRTAARSGPLDPQGVRPRTKRTHTAPVARRRAAGQVLERHCHLFSGQALPPGDAPLRMPVRAAPPSGPRRADGAAESAAETFYRRQLRSLPTFAVRLPLEPRHICAALQRTGCPHLRRDLARRRCHICTGTGAPPAHICTGTGLAPAHICAGTWLCCVGSVAQVLVLKLLLAASPTIRNYQGSVDLLQEVRAPVPRSTPEYHQYRLVP